MEVSELNEAALHNGPVSFVCPRRLSRGGTRTAEAMQRDTRDPNEYNVLFHSEKGVWWDKWSAMPIGLVLMWPKILPLNGRIWWAELIPLSLGEAGVPIVYHLD